MIVNFKRLNPDATIPTFGHGDDSNAGIDFYSPIDCEIAPNGAINIDLGLAWEPSNYGLFSPDWKPAMIIKGRSGLSIREGIEPCGAGVIDSSYRGSLAVRLYNTTDKRYFINKGDRIAQGVVILVPVIQVVEVDELSETRRGTNGFGSSGK